MISSGTKIASPEARTRASNQQPSPLITGPVSIKLPSEGSLSAYHVPDGRNPSIPLGRVSRGLNHPKSHGKPGIPPRSGGVGAGAGVKPSPLYPFRTKTPPEPPQSAKPVLKVKLSNRWAVFDCDPDDQGHLKSFFRYPVPGAEFSSAYKFRGWDGFANLMARGRVASGLFLEKQKELAREYRLKIRHEEVMPYFKPRAESDLRPYQIEAVEAMISASNQGGVILSATGSGKTKIAGAYFKALCGFAIFVVDELTLLEQSRIAIEKEIGEKVGVVGRSQFLPERVTIATVQTLAKHCDKGKFKKWFEKVTVVLVDEVHLAINKRNIDVLNKIAPKAVFGLTATLELKKLHIHMPIMALCGPVLFNYPIEQGVKEGYLSEGIVCCLAFNDPLRGMSPGYKTLQKGRVIDIEAGSPDAEYRRRICLNSARNSCIEAIVREAVGRKRRVVVLVERKLHLKMLEKRFQDLKYIGLSGAIHSSIRLDAMKRMDAGDLDVILTTRVFGKGVDVKSVDFIVDATGVPSRNSTLQRYGRGARKTEGKNGLIYVDIADRGSKFEDAAHARLRALKEVGGPIVRLVWHNNAEEVLDLTVGGGKKQWPQPKPQEITI